jgi:hypothetical protein
MSMERMKGILGIRELKVRKKNGLTAEISDEDKQVKQWKRVKQAGKRSRARLAKETCEGGCSRWPLTQRAGHGFWILMYRVGKEGTRNRT